MGPSEDTQLLTMPGHSAFYMVFTKFSDTKFTFDGNEFDFKQDSNSIYVTY